MKLSLDAAYMLLGKVSFERRQRLTFGTKADGIIGEPTKHLYKFHGTPYTYQSLSAVLWV
jgi:hypothetical protein